MTIQMRDDIAVDRSTVRVTRDGYLVATPRIARTGIQDYLGSEVGRPDMPRVRVYRPESEVFSDATVRSMAHRPVTNDHPPVPVDKTNWKRYAVGVTADEVMRDGNFARVPMMLADEAAIADLEAGKSQLSLGYSTDLDWTPGVTADGQQFDAVQRNIRVNHLAVVSRARGGDKLVIGDADGKTCPSCGYSVSAGEHECQHCGHKITTDAEWSPGLHPRVPAGSPAGGQFASAGEAQSFIAGQQKKWKHARVESVEEITKNVPTGLLSFIKPRNTVKKKRYVVKADGAAVTDPVGTPAASESLVDGGDSVITGDQKMAKMTIDGVSCEMPDMTQQVVQRALDQASARVTELTGKQTTDAKSITDLQAQVATLTTQVQAKDAEIVTLKDAAEKAKPTPAMIDSMVSAKVAAVDKGRKILGDKLIVDGKSAEEIRRQVVDAQLGDKAKGWTDDMVRASFDSIATADSGTLHVGAPGFAAHVPGVTDVAAGFVRPAGGGAAQVLTDAYTDYQKELEAGRGKAA